MPLIILSILVQLALVVHIIKTGRNTTWVFIVLFFPLIGTLAYIIVELLPEFTGTRTARKVQRKLVNAIDPEKAYREAAEQYALSDTVQNAITLAAHQLRRGQHAEAKALYQKAMSGLYASDPDVLLGFATAQFGLGEYAQALQSLDTLKEKNPDRTTGEGHLLYARTLQALGRGDEAVAEYEALLGYHPGPEAACRLAQLCHERGNPQRAKELYEQVVAQSRRSNAHYNELHKEWIAQARRAL